MTVIAGGIILNCHQISTILKVAILNGSSRLIGGSENVVSPRVAQTDLVIGGLSFEKIGLPIIQSTGDRSSNDATICRADGDI